MKRPIPERLTDRRELQATQAAIVDAAFDSIITIDEAGCIQAFNPAAEATFGYRRSDVLGRPLAALIVPPHLREAHARGMSRYLATGRGHMLGQRVEIEAMRADGSIFPVELAIAEVRLADRRLFTAYLRDISERHRMTAALAESEARLRAIVEDQTELIARYDPDFRLTFSNRAHARLFGVEPETLLGSDLFEAVPIQLRQELRARLTALTPDNPVDTGENEKTLASGEIRWFAWINRALFDGDGCCTGYQAVGRDITVAKRVEQALRASEARFVAAAESIPDGLAILDRDDRLVFFNDRHRELVPPALQAGLRIGIRFEDWIRDGMTRGPVYHADMGPDYASRRLATRGGDRTEREHKHADGRWVRIREGQMPDGGRVLLTVDETARREAEEALKRSEARLAAFMQHAPVGMYLKDVAGRYLMANPEMAKVFERPVAEVVGRTPEDVFTTDEAATIRAYDREMIESGAATVHEEHLPTSRDYAWSMVIRFPVSDEAGQITHIAGFDVNITKQKQTEAELARQRDLAHQREKLASLGSLLAGVAHELNNPLSVVVGRAIMLETAAGDPKAQASLGRLRAAAERCARIVKSFLALAREKPREARPVDVRAVLTDVIEILAYGLRSADVEILREDQAELPHVLADDDQLHQVFLNLIVNAQQALETAPLPRQLWLRTALGENVVRIEVADNGPGVPPQRRGQVFEPFFTTKPFGVGTGLGLSVCHGIVSAHGGAISIEDRPGGGARFVVTLPVTEHDRVREIAEPLHPGHALGGDVLVVDDEAEVVAMLQEGLVQDGHRVVTASDGATALELLRHGWFDAILCDLRMPRLDGVALARALQAIRPELSARLLLMTGDTLRAAAVLPSEVRDRLLEKPLDPQEVRRRVQELVSRAR
jgi:PAS domain S-box-containing protein